MKRPVKDDKNNPLGQRDPSDVVGDGIEGLKHGQSAELVESVRKHAAAGKEPDPRDQKQGAAYDLTRPDRQPGKVVRQKDLGKTSLHKREGLYTQDNEEENP